MTDVSIDNFVYQLDIFFLKRVWFFERKKMAYPEFLKNTKTESRAMFIGGACDTK